MFKWLTWFRRVRSAVFGKPLDEILATFDKLVVELEEFDQRTRAQMDQELQTIQAMQARYDIRVGEVDKAQMVRANIHTLMTQHLVAPGEDVPEVEEVSQEGEEPHKENENG